MLESPTHSSILDAVMLIMTLLNAVYEIMDHSFKMLIHNTQLPGLQDKVKLLGYIL